MKRETLEERTAFFRKHGGFSYPEGASAYVKGRERTRQAIELARSEMRAEELGLVAFNEDETEAWDNMPGEDAPEYVFCVCVYMPEETYPSATLGMVGVNSLDDPHLRVVAANLFEEVLATIDANADALATVQAEELASRATYAGV